jgi:hypothetical protein
MRWFSPPDRVDSGRSSEHFHSIAPGPADTPSEVIAREWRAFGAVVE